jgi:hypothetical protein
MSDVAGGADVDIDLFAAVSAEAYPVLAMQFVRGDVAELYREEMVSVGAVEVSPDLRLPRTPVNAVLGFTDGHLGLVTLQRPDGNVSRILPPENWDGDLGPDWICLAEARGAMLLWLPSDMKVGNDVAGLWRSDVLGLRASVLVT